MLNIFFKCIYSFTFLLWRESFTSPANLLIRLLSSFLLCFYTSWLQNFDISPLLVVWCKYFPPFSTMSLFLVVASFDVQKLFILMWSVLFIFSFVFCASGGKFSKMFLSSIIVCFVYVFYHKYVTDSCLTYKTFFNFYFKLIFVYGVSKYTCFIFSNVAI